MFALCAWCVCAVGTVCVKCTGVRDAMATACMCVQRGGHGGCARSACVVREGRTWELVSAERTGAARGERDVSLVRVARDHAGDHAGVARSAMAEAGRLRRTRKAGSSGSAWTSRRHGGQTVRIIASGSNGGARGAGDSAARGRRRGSSEAMKTKVSPCQAHWGEC